MVLTLTRIVGLALAIGISATATAVRADGCPADKVLKQPRKLDDIPEKHLKRETLAEIKLEGWRKVGDLLLRMRRLTIQPGGFVPTHYHDDRPSIVYIISGEIWEHSSFCSVPIHHKANQHTPEFGDFQGHWWENKGNVPTVLISADVIPPEYRDTMD
ncbi:cupin [Rhabdaerophilum sp. SD176]|uniref:cupin domain-containing protein n=1 Tax=Rhabdaerophilum sp. SD176 TaxID=2983548 RepID=UPI0024E02834|nr:cupin [Rhabdaerophilum sp. SD176]